MRIFIMDLLLCSETNANDVNSEFHTHRSGLQAHTRVLFMYVGNYK